LDASIQEIIKNIIQIDKSAENIKVNFEAIVNERKQLVNKDIEKLREEIVEGQINKVKEMKCENMKKTSLDAEKIRQTAMQNSNEMYEKFLRQKETIVKDIFNTIMKI
jgi:hypothetical protein